MNKFRLPSVLLMLMLLLTGSTAWANPLQDMNEDIQTEAVDDLQKMGPHLELLWRNSIERNPTLVLALQKMAEKSGVAKAPVDKKSWTQSVVSNIVSLGGMGSSIALGNPAPLIGSTMISTMTSGTDLAKQLSQVNSTDLVILMREVERVQSQLIENYVQFRHSVNEESMLEKDINQLQMQSVNAAQGIQTPTDKVNALIIDLATKLDKAKQKTETYRNLLILSAGEEPVSKIEEQLRHHAT